jgi:hypothetical protein
VSVLWAPGEGRVQATDVRAAGRAMSQCPDFDACIPTLSLIPLSPYKVPPAVFYLRT